MTVSKTTLDIRPIDWTGLPKRFMNDGELETLIALLRSVLPAKVIEIGCNEGRTAKAILDNVRTVIQYQGIDVHAGYQFEKPVQKLEIPAEPGKYALGDQRFELIVRERGSFDITQEELIDADAVFIDGDHGTTALKNDTNLALEKLSLGGIVVWHDYHGMGCVDVKSFLDGLVVKGWPIRHVDGTWLAYMHIDPFTTNLRVN